MVLTASVSAAHGQGRFIAHTIDTVSNGNAGLFAADIDGDGDTDFVTTSIKGDEVAWWRNSGTTPLSWTKHVVAAGFEGALYVHAADIDGDSHIDIAATGGKLGEEGMLTGVVAWWKNLGGDPIAWEHQTVTDEFQGAHAIVSGDFNSDGTTDLLVSASQLNRLSCWLNSGTDPVEWTERLVTGAFPATQTVQAVDIDGDGWVDVLGGSGGQGENSNQLAWWRSDDGGEISWTKQTIAEDFPLVHWVHAADVDDDGRIDVLGASFLGNEIAWWRNGGGNPIEWTKHTVDAEFVHPLTVFAADMDNDGDTDVLGTAWLPDSDIAWWEQVGSHPNIEWSRQDLSTVFTGAWPILATDLDGDGDVDVLAGADALNAPVEPALLTWWENTRRP